MINSSSIFYSDIIIIRILFRIPGLRRIDAAKELFNAFVTRTQAYKLHHSFGLTLFSTLITVKLNITKNVEEFEVSYITESYNNLNTKYIHCRK